MEKRRIMIVLAIAVGLVSFAATGQQSASNASSQTAAEAKIAPGTLAAVEMTSDIDVKKAHAGDIFQTKLWEDVRSGDRIVLPSKTILVGHVVDAQPRTKANPESKLTIAFDKAIFKDGSKLSLHGWVQRVQLSSIAVAAADRQNHSYNPGLNPGSTTNIAMPSQTSQGGQDSPLGTPGPTNIPDPNILVQGDAAGALTVFSSTTKEDVKLKRFATLDVRITHTGE